MSIVRKTILEKVSLSVEDGPLYFLQKKTVSEQGNIVYVEYSELANKLFSNVVETIWEDLSTTEETKTLAITKQEFQGILSTFDNIFICPDCGSMGLDRSLGNVLLTTPVLKAIDGGNFPELDEDTVLDGTFDYYQCGGCNFQLDCAEDELYPCLVEMNKKRLAKK